MTFLRPLILFSLLALAATASAQAPSRKAPGQEDAAVATYSGGDGSSCEAAVRIEGITGTRDGIQAEKAWLRKRFPGYTFRGESLRDKGGRQFEVIDITTGSGDKSICFDITAFFGRW